LPLEREASERTVEVPAVVSKRGVDDGYYIGESSPWLDKEKCIIIAYFKE
jgi:hypothetical protein